MSEDAREIAHRIVREVLEAHEAPGDGLESAETPPEVDLRETGGAGTADAVADAVDETPARQAARRIVAEVLAAHAEASRSSEHELPVAEAEEPGPTSVSPVLQPQAGRPAVLPAVPEAPSVEVDDDVAEDAVAIARRIVASVLAEQPDGGPPAIPAAIHGPVVVADAPLPRLIEDTPPRATAPEEPDPDAPDQAAAGGPEADADDPSWLVLDERPVEPVEPVVAHGSYALRPEEPAAEPEPEPEPPAAETEPEPPAADVGDDLAPPTREPTEQCDSQSPETTAVLPPDADPDVTTRVPVATLERAPEREADGPIEPTVSIPSATAPRRTGRWLLASVFGAVALAVLLPLAVEALRTLVAFS